ncbi:GntR family transcriptional regulator [Aminicella lysinilytica]|uniref:GntR family transcriptional regulator n=2 Tax=Aminicella lysinilytica TaxID=433323 RepID=A0A4R6Q0W2_9FIRM|nr:GntR family transcriptional regulator [Aminicella lysinilytica]NLD10788.1 GntR family transcriptional regulator [Clostridiales bacterium]TDP54627.1 GntR family transcriptional regulator [Aminicella lysinilytica]
MFQLDSKSHLSIYEQVIENIKELIMTDILAEDSKLPSVRELSKDLTVNPNTVQKAFKELEREGYIYTISGKGTFVSPKDDITTDPSKIAELQGVISAAYKSLLNMGLGEPDVRQLVVDTMNEADSSFGTAARKDLKGKEQKK